MTQPNINTIRWGDRVVKNVGAGESFRSQDFFRVTSPFPQCWKILANVALTDPANNGVFFGLIVTIGVGAFTRQQTFQLIPGSSILVEIPGQNMSGRVFTGPAVNADQWTFDAVIAPFVPWQYLTVSVDNTPRPDPLDWNAMKARFQR